MKPEFTFFLDENHHRTLAVHEVLTGAELGIEYHHAYFEGGTPDRVWLPLVGQRGWVLLPSDTRIRHHYSEREQVIASKVRLFCFSSNNQTGVALGETLRRALPRMLRILREEPPPFFATIDKEGQVHLRNFKTIVCER